MFRDVTRFKQKLPPEECVALLKRVPRGVLSVMGDDGYPYGMPINHWYCEDDGHLYFHSGAAGHRIDALRACDKVSYCVMEAAGRNEGEWWLNFRSVIVFGRARFIEDHERALDISRALSRQFIDDERAIEDEIRQSGARVLCFELIPEHITGKRVKER